MAVKNAIIAAKRSIKVFFFIDCDPLIMTAKITITSIHSAFFLFSHIYQKRIMRKITTLLLCCISIFFATANDGVFYASGNQLIPITETDISVKKEVLTINRVGDHIEVTVYYEFFNPVGEKELLVGFEAESPYNSRLDPIALFPNHPHIRNFKVVVNGEPLQYEIAHVERGRYDENEKYVLPPYYSNGQFKGWSKKQCEDSLKAWDYNAVPFDYVYHFKAKFRPGLNIIQHTYEFDLSESVEEEFYFPYILTAANRWANHQIDNFQLNINMGPYVSFHLFPDFFESPDEWSILGRGKFSTDTVWGYTDGRETPVFHIQEGGLIFRKANFHPNGELRISQRRDWSISSWSWGNEDDFDAESILNSFKDQYIPIVHPAEQTKESSYYTMFSPDQRRILKNLPFAYRGYIFKNKNLQDYFESTEWYLPNPKYDGNMEAMSAEEKKWVEFWGD